MPSTLVSGGTQPFGAVVFEACGRVAVFPPWGISAPRAGLFRLWGVLMKQALRLRAENNEFHALALKTDKSASC